MRRVLRPHLAGIATAVLAIGLVAPSIASASKPDESRTGPQSLIFYGSGAGRGEYPWQVALASTDPDIASADGNGVHCGGTLISPRRVLTAAHCVAADTPDEVEVVAGKQRLSEATAANRYAVASISQAAPRLPDRRDLLVNARDVAVLTLAKPVVNARPLRLVGPEGSRDDALWAPGTTLRTSGWGRKEDRTKPDLLQVANVKRIDDARCARLDPDFSRDAGLCVGNPVRPARPTSTPVASACYDDSGGPLIAPTVADPDPRDPADWRLVGVVSGGRACGSSAHPVIYGRLAAPWAQQLSRDPDPIPQPRREANPRFENQLRPGAAVRCTPGRYSGAVTEVTPPTVSLGGIAWQASRDIPNDGSYVLTTDDVGLHLACDQVVIGPGGIINASADGSVLPGTDAQLRDSNSYPDD
jgi:hypothetical protein